MVERYSEIPGSHVMVSPYALIYLIATVTPAIIGFFALILYTHLLSPNEYGFYVIGASIAGIISAIFFAWVRLAVARFQAKSPDADLRSEAVVAYGGTVMVIACLTPVAVLVARPSFGFGFIAGSLVLSLSMTAFELSQEFRRAGLNPVRYTMVAVLRGLLGLALGYFAIRLGGGGLGLLLAIGASFLIANVLSLQTTATKPFRLFSAPHLSQFVSYGLPFSLGALAFALHSTLDRLGVAYLLGQNSAGYYGLAADMSRQFIVIFAGSVASAMFPLAFRSLATAGAAATRERLKEGFELLLALIAPIAVWLAISADIVAGTLLGTEFQMSVATLLPVLAFGRMCGAINQFYVQISFQLAERPLLQVIHDSLILGLNLVLLIFLTLSFGLIGSALAILIAEAAGILIGMRLSRRAFPLPLNAAGLTRVLISTAIMSLATYSVRVIADGHGIMTLLALAAVGGGAYAGAALVFDVAGIRSTIMSLHLPRWFVTE